MRRFNVAPGERIEFEFTFDDLLELRTFGFENGDFDLRHPRNICLFVNPEDLLRLAEACRQAYFDAVGREDVLSV